MSLINQMLKDIENRSRYQMKPELALSGLHVSELRKNLTFHWKIIFAILLLFCLLTFFIKIFVNHQYVKNFAQTAKLPTITQPLNINAEKLIKSHITPSVLTGITFQIQQNITSVRFLLSQDALYRVDYDKIHEKLIIFLDHSHLIASLPPIDYQNSAIKNMQIFNAITGDLKIVLELHSEAEVKQLQLNEKGKYPELVLDLLLPDIQFKDTNNSSEKTVAITQNDKAIKKLVVNMTLQDQYNKALNSLSLGEDQKAQRLLRELVANYPEYYLARESLAKLLLQNGNNKGAEKLLEVGLRLQPTYIPFIEMRARILADEGKTQQALNVLQSVMPSMEENPDYHAFIAALYQRQGESMIAAKMYEQLLRLDPNKAVWWVGLGIALEALNKHSEALQAYGKANISDGLTPELRAYIENQTQSI